MNWACCLCERDDICIQDYRVQYLGNLLLPVRYTQSPQHVALKYAQREGLLYFVSSLQSRKYFKYCHQVVLK
jgi:hypothetical protein